MQAQLSEGGRFFGMILIEPTCSTSLACCAISFIRLTRAVPLGSNFALGFGAFSNVLAMVIPRWIASSVPDGTFNSERLGEHYRTAVWRHATLGDAVAAEAALPRECRFAAALRSVADTTPI